VNKLDISAGLSVRNDLIDIQKQTFGMQKLFDRYFAFKYVE